MSWLIDSWHLLLPKPWSVIMLGIFAVLCGSWVGIERERREKPAGVRTMALVALGSCVFTMIGFVFTNNAGDSGRVAAQIVAGVGFLGAGVIIRGSGGVRGTTTAATIWAVAAMGLAIGAGYAPGGGGLALLIRAVLSLVGRWELSHYGGQHETTIRLIFNPDHGKTEIKIERLLDEYAISKSVVLRSNDPDGRQRWVIQCRLTARHSCEFLSELVEIPEVYAIER
ncbi:MAG: MgtC/SapB family protein [Verrucomicrobia bacterium]|nr:MgtC/SapB family protein [Verrucomicrobiota bacterium]MBV9299843.1 MgtC/SapB family protein [Verrucomicrobiota bacterium]